MRVTFLGTGAATSVPLAFCRCEMCNEARKAGGKDMRRRSSLLIDGKLIIDFGPDVLTAAAEFGADVTGISLWLQTHAHSDHYDPGHIITRISEYASVDVPKLSLYASEVCVSLMSEKLAREEEDATFQDALWQERMNMDVFPLSPSTRCVAGAYEILALPADHGMPGEALMYVVSDGDRSALYATDTASIPDAAIECMREEGVRLDMAIMDHTYGPGIKGGGHMSADDVIAAIDRLRSCGVLKKEGRAIATHISHEGMPAHEALTNFARERDYEIAYDGMVIEI